MLEKKTKIICTIGPATWDPNVMRALIENGMNCARVNGAFADPDELDKVAKLVRDVSNEVSLMVDVKGPEVRMNKFATEKNIKPGDEIIIGNTEADEIYPSNYKDLYTKLKPGQRLVIGDGDVELVLKQIEGDKMHCVVIYGKVLKPGKALNLPGAEIATEFLTEKDKINLEHSIKTGWDFVSASFVQTAESARKIREYITEICAKYPGSQMKLIAKIEDQQGFDNIDSILPEVDGVMIARGGLGVELGLERVPLVQRVLLKKCNEAGKPVISATQMLESMIENPRPTRAEASDVATSILLGSDCLMLSGESSAGKYPVDAVKFLTSSAKVIENSIAPQVLRTRAHASTTTDALTKAAAEMCINLGDEISSVIVVSKSGTTARLLTRHSIKQPVYAFVENDFLVRTLMLSKGIYRAFTFKGIAHDSPDYNRDSALKIIVEESLAKGVVQKGQKVLFIGKTPVEAKGYFPNMFEVIEI